MKTNENDNSRAFPYIVIRYMAAAYGQIDIGFDSNLKQGPYTAIYVDINNVRTFCL